MNRRRLFDIIQIGNRSDPQSRIFDLLVVVNIALNITVLFLQTFDELSRLEPLFLVVEQVTVFFFIVEYIMRLWTSDFLFPGESRGRAAVRFACSFDGVVELLTILPFTAFTGFIAFRMLRVVRIFHLFRINATYDSFNVIKDVLYEKRNQLLSSVFIILILMLAASLSLYAAEHDAQPEVFRNGFSGVWWSMSTLLTVGYGDIYPVTAMGRLLAIIIAFLGVGAVAIPTGIISAGFVEHYTRAQGENDEGGRSFHCQTVVIDIDSAWIGKTSAGILREYGKIVAMVQRGDRQFVPEEDYTVRMGDALAVFPDRSEG